MLIFNVFCICDSFGQINLHFPYSKDFDEIRFQQCASSRFSTIHLLLNAFHNSNRASNVEIIIHMYFLINSLIAFDEIFHHLFRHYCPLQCQIINVTFMIVMRFLYIYIIGIQKLLHGFFKRIIRLENLLFFKYDVPAIFKHQ
jgi:hypothetical protein